VSVKRAVDVGALADVPGHHAADEARAEGAEEAHQAQRLDAHLTQVLGALVALVDAGEELNLSRISALEGRFSG